MAHIGERLVWRRAYLDNDLVFNYEEGSPLHPDWFSKQFESHVHAAGLPPIRLHDLRHTHATLALAAGVPRRSCRSGWVTPAFPSPSIPTPTPSRRSKRRRRRRCLACCSEISGGHSPSTHDPQHWRTKTSGNYPFSVEGGCEYG
jgi:hypothetical protein